MTSTSTGPKTPSIPSSHTLDSTLDPLDALLNLEETFYHQGYTLGHADGARQGLTEGRLFGAERGFDKFAAMARLHGHAIVLGNRLPGVLAGPTGTGAEARPSVQVSRPLSSEPSDTAAAEISGGLDVDGDSDPDLAVEGADADAGGWQLDPVAVGARLEKHVRTLWALTEPASLALRNDEDEVSEFDDRFKRAQAKAVIVGRMVGYELEGVESGTRGKGITVGNGGGKESGGAGGQGAEASIEDTSILQARH